MARQHESEGTSETADLKEELNSLKIDVRKEAVKRVIASMTSGKDMSLLFPHVVKCIETASIELKKLVYLYIINYAKKKADMAIMAIHSFRKDAHEATSPLLRALAIRTMGCLRIEKITEYLCESLRDGLADSDPYVRKTAALCVTKLFATNPRLVKDNGFVKLLQEALADGNSSVVANAVAALLEITSLTGRNYIRLNSSTMQKLLYAINECSEWGQIYILEGIAKYRPVDSKDAENIIERVSPRLSHANPAVVLAAAKVVLELLDSVTTPEIVTKMIKRLGGPLVTLLANSAEIQYVVLRNINFILEKRRRIFDEPRVFFVRHSDPLYVKLEKLEILGKVVSSKNIDAVLTELAEYSRWLEVEFVRKAIRTIALIGSALPKATKRALELLLESVKGGSTHAIEECAVGIAEILRHEPDIATDSNLAEIISKTQSLSEPDSRAAYVWVLGQYCEQIPKADELLKACAEGWLEEPAPVQHQLLVASVKLYLRRPEGNDQFITQLLQRVGEESENPDLRDRAYIYWRLLNADPNNAAAVVFPEGNLRPAPEDLITIYDDDYVDYLVANMATTVSVNHKRPEEFIPDSAMIKKVELSDDEADADPKTKPKPKPKQTSEFPSAAPYARQTEGAGGSKRRHRRRRQLEPAEEEEQPPERSPERGQSNGEARDQDQDKDKDKKKGKEKKKSPGKEESLQQEEEKEAGKSQGTGGFDLLDLGDIVGEDLTINSEDIEFLSEGGKGNIVEAYKDTQAGSSGTVGVAVTGAFVRSKGVIMLKLVVMNKSAKALDNVSVGIDKNSFGLAVSKPASMNIASSSKKRLEVLCAIAEWNLNSSQPPGCPFELQITLKATKESFSFRLPCMLHVFFAEGSQLPKEEFKKYWQTFDKSKEVALDIASLKPTCSNAEAMKLVLENFNISLTTLVKKPENGQVMLYCSCQTVNRLPLVMELSIPASQPGLAARALVRVPVVPLGPLVLESLKFILVQQLPF